MALPRIEWVIIITEPTATQSILLSYLHIYRLASTINRHTCGGRYPVSLQCKPLDYRLHPCILPCGPAFGCSNSIQLNLVLLKTCRNNGDFIIGVYVLISRDSAQECESAERRQCIFACQRTENPSRKRSITERLGARFWERLMTRSCCFISRLSAKMAFAPPGPKSLARVVNRCMSKKTRSFMVQQGRADCGRKICH